MMTQTAINKPIYDAFKDAGASEEKSTLAARAVLPSVDDVATGADIERLRADIAELKTDLLKWIAIMIGLAVTAIGLIVAL